MKLVHKYTEEEIQEFFDKADIDRETYPLEPYALYIIDEEYLDEKILIDDENL